MNEITHEGSTTQLIINIPPYDGLGSFRLEYKHELRKPFPYLLKIALTVNLYLEEIGGNKKFKITSALCKYRIKVNDELTVKDLASVWYKSASHVVKSFNDFEEKRFGKKNEINFSTEEEFEKLLSPHVQWFYNSPQN